MIRSKLKFHYLLLSASFFENSKNFKENSDNSNKYNGLFTSDKWERVILLFQKDDMGHYHPDLEFSIQMTTTGIVVGGVLNGFLESYKQIYKYLEKSDSHLFLNKKEAYKMVSRHSIIGFSKGLWKGAFKLGVFIGGFMLIACSAQAFRGKKGIIEYSFGGFSIGALLKFNYGWRGMLSGGIVGGTMGSFFGIFNWAKLKLLKLDENEYRSTLLSIWKQKSQ